MRDPLDLTFGIEIECIVLFDADSYREAIPLLLLDKSQELGMSYGTKLRIICRNHIIKAFRDGGFQTYGYGVGGGYGVLKWTVAPDVSISIVDGPRTDDGFFECDVEIKSPALRFCPKALLRVKRLIELLRNEFNVFVNDSCGFHVHIGNRKIGFPLQTVKHLCMLTAMFEHQLNTLHPAHRIENQCAKPPSALFKGQNPWETVAIVQSCRSKAQLVKLYTGSRRDPDRCFAYNLLPLVSGGHQTIEFRQHKGTIDWAEMMNWVQVAGGLVAAMHQISTGDLAQLISTCAFDRRFTVLDLLLRLGLDALIPFYTGRLHVLPRPEPLWVPGTNEGSAEHGPRRLPGYGRWDELVKRHRLERAQEVRKLEEIDRRHELETQRELERQVEEVVAAPGAS